MIPPSQQTKETCPCARTLFSAADWIECSHCDQWWHTKCTGNLLCTQKYYNNSDIPFVCIVCQAKSVTSKAVKDLVILNLCPNTVPDPSASRTSTSSAKNINSTSSTSDTCNLGNKDTPNSKQDISETESAPHAQESVFPIHTSSERSETSLSDTEKDNLVILDSNKIPRKYKNSQFITLEINKHKPHLKFTDTYTLHLGGIVIQCKDEKSKEEALKPWPTEAFDGAGVQAHTPSFTLKPNKVFVRNIPRTVSTAGIATAVEYNTGSKCKVRQLFNRRTKQYMPIAEITLENREKLNTLIVSGLKIGKHTLPIEAKRSTRVIRCYKCQEFGHPARFCNNDQRCVDCGEVYIDIRNHTCNKLNCVNCNKQHSSDSKFCDYYRTLLLKLSHRNLHNESACTKHTVDEYINNATGGICREERHRPNLAKRDLEQFRNSEVQELEH